jgi:HK97 family phage major capsid protein
VNTQVSSDNFELLFRNMEQMTELTAKPTFSTKDEKLHNQLLFDSALIKRGMSSDEIKRFNQERLLRAAGLPRLPERARSKMDQEVESEWRKFAKGDAVRSTYVPDESESRANEAGTQTISYTQQVSGGSFVPQGMYGRAYAIQKKYDSIYDEQFSNVVETENGSPTSFPIWDDVNSQSSQITETTSGTEVDVAAFGTKLLGAYTFRSGIVAVSIELLEDSNFPIGQVLERVFAYRHARGGGVALVSGSGSNAPQGLITGSVAAGATIIVASGANANDNGGETGATSIGSTDLWKAYQALNAAYRPGACWAMNDLTLLAISDQLDKQGRPIVSYRRGLTDVDGDVPYILGKPVAICPSFPNAAGGQNSVCFYNPLFYVQRRVPSAARVQRFSQNGNLITFGLYGFQSYLRMDSGLISSNPSFVPASVIQNHS